jgi:hypothetical protein
MWGKKIISQPAQHGWRDLYRVGFQFISSDVVNCVGEFATRDMFIKKMHLQDLMSIFIYRATGIPILRRHCAANVLKEALPFFNVPQLKRI